MKELSWSEIDGWDDPPEQPQQLQDADFHGCRYIEGQPTPLRRGLFCGARRVPGSSWCAAHHKIVSRVTPRRRYGR